MGYLKEKMKGRVIPMRLAYRSSMLQTACLSTIVWFAAAGANLHARDDSIAANREIIDLEFPSTDGHMLAAVPTRIQCSLNRSKGNPLQGRDFQLKSNTNSTLRNDIECTFKS